MKPQRQLYTKNVTRSAELGLNPFSANRRRKTDTVTSIVYELINVKPELRSICWVNINWARFDKVWKLNARPTSLGITIRPTSLSCLFLIGVATFVYWVYSLRTEISKARSIRQGPKIISVIVLEFLRIAHIFAI